MSEHHWYATTCFDWVCAGTKEEAIKKLARVSGSMIGKDGIEALVCKVNLPIKAHYRIEEYLPTGVDREPAKRVRILNKKGNFTE